MFTGEMNNNSSSSAYEQFIHVLMSVQSALGPRSCGVVCNLALQQEDHCLLVDPRSFGVELACSPRVCWFSPGSPFTLT